MKGIKPEWKALPKRKCDNCGLPYRPGRPMRPGEKGFHSDNCRKEFHKHGGSYSKLKPYVEKYIKQRIKELSPADAVRIEALEKRIETLEEVIVSFWDVLAAHAEPINRRRWNAIHRRQAVNCAQQTQAGQNEAPPAKRKGP